MTVFVSFLFVLRHGPLTLTVPAWLPACLLVQMRRIAMGWTRMT